jgi:hypothetical protein
VSSSEDNKKQGKPTERPSSPQSLAEICLPLDPGVASVHVEPLPKIDTTSTYLTESERKDDKNFGF